MKIRYLCNRATLVSLGTVEKTCIFTEETICYGTELTMDEKKMYGNIHVCQPINVRQTANTFQYCNI